ncbi:unnamed protein product [Brassicogethes aeneus]|uniref:AAA+ ATPase domain-containing protein n=1 Tax=Brassicogethes aeneus TaxID=1431903 RepID=A0A9P0APU9_BRAAE|nr:unnamed protein product [Brassicogethes aeneus]
MLSSRNNLNRSVSSPDLLKSLANENRCQGLPVVRKVVVEQYFNTDFSPISYRQISCEQIYSPITSAKEYPKIKRNLPINRDIFDTTLDSSLHSNLDEPRYCKYNQESYKNDVIPMDIDNNEFIEDLSNKDFDKTLCDQKDNNMYEKVPRKHNYIKNLRTNQLEPITTESGLKKRTAYKENRDFTDDDDYDYIPSIPIIREEESISLGTLVKWFFLIIVAYGAYEVYTGDYFIFVNSELQLANIKHDLETLVYNQADSIRAIANSLEERPNWPNKLKVVGFIGTSGVGKTYIANIVKKYFHPRLVHELNGHNLGKMDKQKTIVDGINPSSCNLIVIDDLHKDDSDAVFAFIDSLPRDSFILVLCIYNIQYGDDNLDFYVDYKGIDVIRKKFEGSKLCHDLVVLNELNIDWGRKYLEKISSSKNVGKDVYDKIIYGLLKNHKFDSYGLKGLYPKLMTELESVNKYN